MSRLPILGLAALLYTTPAVAQDSVSDKPYTVEVTQAPEKGQIIEPSLDSLRSTMGMYVNTDSAEIVIHGQGDGVIDITAYKLDNGCYVQGECLSYQAEVPDGVWTLTYNWNLAELSNECLGDIRFKAVHGHDPTTPQEDKFKISPATFRQTSVESEPERRPGKHSKKKKESRNK
ncbi:MAG: hypothetical protein ABIG93_00025 [archaeon]|nr:hypothetical protein [Nanoarchaeota archaeon]